MSSQLNNGYRSPIELKPTPKKHTVGLDKAIAPAETVRRIKGVFKGIDLDLMREVKRIDSGRLDIPVYVCRAGKDCNTPTPGTMGKGPTPDQSEASALMELVERYSHANFPPPRYRQWKTLKEMDGNTPTEGHFFWLPDKKAVVSDEARMEFSSLPFCWVPALNLLTAKSVAIPYEWFADIQGTNGLSAGNTLEETIIQGLCEVVERHVCGVINASPRSVPTIDLETVRDPVARELIGKFSRNGIRLMCMDFSLDTGIPTVGGVAFDPATFPNSEIVYCAGTATHPQKALIRALTEIQQMAVDNFQQDYYAGGILPKFSHWRESSYLFSDGDPVSIDSLPDVSADDMLTEIQNCVAALGNIGWEPLAVDITHPLLKVPAVFIVVPGAEQYEHSSYRLNTTYYLGRRWGHIGKFDRAIRRFQQSKKQLPPSALHCSIEVANCLKYDGQWEAAIAAYKEALLLKPDRAMQYRIFNSLTQCTKQMEK